MKFISKARIVSDCWVDDPMLGRVSQEIAILTRVQHHNIVKVNWSLNSVITGSLNLTGLFSSHSCVCVIRFSKCLRMEVTSRW